MENKIYFCIDLKSFYASVECVERGLDPFSTNLVVADPSRGAASICLAITPAMKTLGIANRCRIFEIPEHIPYLTAKPHMRKYMQVSARICSIYFRYIAPEDIHVYSIDEVFIDASPYLHLYHMTPKQLAEMLVTKVKEETGICATAGIGTNLFLAKVALDITAKRTKDGIGFLDETTFQKNIWHHRPITDIWNIGKGIAKRLERYFVKDLYGITQLPEDLLYRTFGVNAELLIDHAWGRESCTIADIHNYKARSRSICNSQILFENYNYTDTLVVLKEMIDTLVLELIEKNCLLAAFSFTSAMPMTVSNLPVVPENCRKKRILYKNYQNNLKNYLGKLQIIHN